MLPEDTSSIRNFAVAVITPAVQDFVAKWIIATKNTFSAIIQQAVLLREAKNKLGSDNYKMFLDEIKISESVSKKLMKIADSAELLNSHQSVMPTSWTTVYKIAALKKPVFMRLLESGKLSSHMTALDVNRAIGTSAKPSDKEKNSSAKPSDKEKNSYDTVTFNFSKLSVDAKERFAEFYDWIVRNEPPTSQNEAITINTKFHSELRNLSAIPLDDEASNVKGPSGITLQAISDNSVANAVY